MIESGSVPPRFSIFVSWVIRSSGRETVALIFVACVVPRGLSGVRPEQLSLFLNVGSVRLSLGFPHRSALPRWG